MKSKVCEELEILSTRKEVQDRKKRKEILLCSGHNERGVVAGSAVLA